MDLVRLGEPYSTSYLPEDEVVQGYSSLIWTERLISHGEFELKTTDISRFRSLFPEDTLISHLDTQEVMVVETHSITSDPELGNSLTITGRSLTKILENRTVGSKYQKRRRMRKKYSSTAAACVLLYNAVDNGSGFDVTRGDKDGDTPEQNSYPWNTLDKIPNVSVSETVPVEGNQRWWNLEGGPLYPQLVKILGAQDLGLRTMRPVPGARANIITVKSALADRGDIVRTPTDDPTSLRFDVFKGVDRQATVAFNHLQKHITSPQHLFSRRDWASGVDIRSGEVSFDEIYRPDMDANSGILRRMIDYDAGSPEIPPEPEKPDELRKNATKAQREARADAMDKWLDAHARWKNKRDAIVSDFREEVKDEARDLLRDRRLVRMFSGDISESAPYQFKRDYDLGDLVTLNGDYGISQTMVVAEHVRTEDSSGDRGFPGLITP